jgi:hypothetical protein
MRHVLDGDEILLRARQFKHPYFESRPLTW